MFGFLQLWFLPGSLRSGDFLQTFHDVVCAAAEIIVQDLIFRKQLVIDHALIKDEYICGHPGINTSTVRLLREDMLRYVRETKHEPTFIDLPIE